MLSLADDFADDPEASHHDKILEGLIARYEAWRPYRKAIDHLNKASLRDPLLGAMLVMRLNQASERLLTIAGVDLGGINGMLRVKGLSGIALYMQREWMRDDSPDMATTIRSLDQRLRQAEKLASTLRIITPNPKDIQKMTASFDDFMKIDIRLGTVMAVDDFPEARKPA